MTVLNESLLLGDEGGAGYVVERSLRFSSNDSAYLSRTPASAGNRKTWTWAGWVKKTSVSSASTKTLFGVCPSSGSDTTFFEVFFNTSDQIQISNWSTILRQTTQVFRDSSAWYHITIAFNSTLAAGTDQIKLYVNGQRVTSFGVQNNITQNTDYGINQAIQHNIGSERPYNSTRELDGYLADIHFIDGQALGPTSFTEVSATTGQLIPKAYTGSYGTNGFHLDFADNSTAVALGTDTSGNGNDWTVNNIVASTGSSHSFAETGTGLISSTTQGGPFVPRSGAPVGPYGPRYTFDTGSSTVYRFTLSTPGVVTVYSSTSNGYGVPTVRFPETGQSQSYGYLDGVVQSFTSSSPVSYFEYLMLAPQGGQAGYLQGVNVDGVPVVVVPASANDSLVDTPTSGSQVDTGLGGQVTGNYATLNPLAKGSDVTLANGNLDCSTSSSAGFSSVLATIGVTSGKWYWEFTAGSGTLRIGLGIATQAHNLSTWLGGDAYGWEYFNNDGSKATNGGGGAYGASWTTGDVIGVALDADAGTLTFYKNGTTQGQAYSGLTSGPYFPAVADSGTAGILAGSFNFGQRPFAYTAPSGFKALCDTNLPAPVVAKSSDYFQTVLYTGNGSTQTISGLGFSPDLVWIKGRSTALQDHTLVDSVRGVSARIRSNTTQAEVVESGYTVTAFNANGFTVADNTAGGYNVNGSVGGVYSGAAAYVAWTWDAGTSTVTNTQGSITSQVRANASAGFSIVTYTGNGTNPGATIGHGLGVTPGLIIAKSRSAAGEWPSYHSALPISNTIYLNATYASTTYLNRFSAVSSTTFTTGSSGSELNANGVTYVAYCFAPVNSYSAFGAYQGNGSTDGPFVYTGFRPRWILFKNTSQASDWAVYDAARSPYNVTNDYLTPNTSDAEGVDYANGNFDILANGFKIRATWIGENGSGNTLVYAAFAENPFQYARAR